LFIFQFIVYIAFRKNKNIQQHIVKNDINPKALTNLTEPAHKKCNKSCKTCNLISNSNVIKSSTNVTYDLKSKSHCHARNIVYAAKCKQHQSIYVGQTGEELRSRFNKHRYDAKKRPDNNELAKHIYDLNHDLDKDIEIYVLQDNLPLTNERCLQEDKWVCLLGTLTPYGLNVDTNLFAKEMYTSYQKVLTTKNH